MKISFDRFKPLPVWARVVLEVTPFAVYVGAMLYDYLKDQEVGSAINFENDHEAYKPKTKRNRTHRTRKLYRKGA